MNPANAQAVSINLSYVSVMIDLTKPVWFGPYKSAKLGIFEAQHVEYKTPEAKHTFEHSVMYFAIITESADGDFVVYAHYEKTVPSEEVCAHLQSIVWLEYLKNKESKANSAPEPTYVPGPNTLQ